VLYPAIHTLANKLRIVVIPPIPKNFHEILEGYMPVVFKENVDDVEAILNAADFILFDQGAEVFLLVFIVVDHVLESLL
jgi:hypothetical protein